VVTLVSEDNEPLGKGIFDPHSPLAIRVWSTQATTPLDSRLLCERVARAIALRREWFSDGRTTAYRLVNGEGDRLPGFVIDRYDDVAVLRIDGEAARALAPTLTHGLERVLRDAGITTLVERVVRTGQAATPAPPGSRDHDTAKPATIEAGVNVRVCFGPERHTVHVREHGVPFVVDIARGQKTGAFVDQRENRRRVGELVAKRIYAGLGVRVLNLFSYAGGFSQRAALAGAHVTSVDIAAGAHATAQASFRLAGIDPAAHAFVTADAFSWLADQKRKGMRWDVVISDPPSFAPSERAKPKGLSAYRALHRACADVLAPGGTLVAASCSSHVTAEEFAGTLDDLALGRSDLRVTEMFGPPCDHPTLAAFPEGRYLKLVILA